MKANKWKFFSNPQHSCLLLILLMANLAFSQTTIWDGTADTTWYTSNKTASEFTITTAEQLAGLAQLVNGGTGNGKYNMSDKTITLGNDIALNDTTNWKNWVNSAPTRTWTAIGTSNSSFRGTFDGNWHVISGVYINSTSDYHGLFGYLNSSTIKNLGTKAFYIKGNNSVGGLVGYSYDVTVSNSNANGTVSGNSHVGGLVGYSYDVTVSNSYATGTVSGSGNCVGGLVGSGGTVSNSYATGTVSGSRYVGGLVGSGGITRNSYATGAVSGSSEVGGLVGYNEYSDTLSNSYATGTVSGSGNYVGGLVGYNISGSVNNSYATGAVSGSSNYVGGLVGYNSSSTISNSYATGAVSGSSNIGGLVGYSGSYGNVSNSYATGAVLGRNYVGGLVGYISSSSIVRNSYYDKETSGQNDTDKGEGKTTVNMQSEEFVKILNISASSLSMNAWVYSIGNYPKLSNQTADDLNISNYFASGDGTQSNPYIIENKQQLIYFSLLVNHGNNFNGETIMLGNDISLNDTTDWQNWETNPPENAWTTVGISYFFQGTFDGNGYVVRGIYINTNVQGSQGLFGDVYGSTIKNLGIEAFYIKGSGYVGGLVGYNIGNSTVSNSYATGTVSGSGNCVGGLVGYNNNNSTVSNSYATGAVSGSGKYVGGLVGYITSGIVSNSYATGTVSGSDQVGGLVGYNGGTVNNSYATGTVSGSDQVGGLVGFSSAYSTVSNNYATGAVSGSSEVGGLVGDNSGTTISNNYATGTVSGNGNYVGGLVGYGYYSTVSNNYATGAVSGSDYVGGLVGYNGNNNTVSNSYATGTVSGSGNYVGGLVGYNYGTVSKSYYDSQTSGRSDTYKGEGKTTEEMQTQSTYIDWDFEEIWNMDPIINDGYPVFQNQIESINKQFISASQVYFASQWLKNDSIPTTIEFYLNGNPVEPVLDSVTLNGKKLTEGIDYEITYANNSAVGTAKIIIEGKGDYIGTKILDFYITEHRDIANATVADIPDQIHTGSAINYKPVIKDFGGAVTLIENTDYELSYSNNINEGYATISIVGQGVYDGTSTSVEFKIVDENDLSGKATIAFANPPVSYTYSGEKYTPDITVTHFEDGILEKGKDYAVFYGDNTNAGTGTVTAAGIGNYTGELQIDFAIIAKPLEVEWESNRVFEYNKMVQYPKASIEENIQFNVLNTHSAAGVYSGSDAALFTLTNNIDLQNYDIINPTADYEIAKKGLSVRFLVSNPAEDFDANQDTVWVPTEIFRDSVLLHGTLLNLLSYDGFATNTETNESDNASVLSGVPAIEIRYSEDGNFSAFFKRVETTQTATAEINADSVTADNYTILSRNVVVMETVSEDDDAEKIYCRLGEGCAQLSEAVCEAIGGEMVETCDESEIDLSLQLPLLSSAGPFRAWQTMSGAVNVDLGYNPVSPIVLEVRDLKGKLVASENLGTRFASVKINAASGVYVLKAGSRNAVAVVK